MPRAMGSFRAIGWEVVPFPVDYVTGNAVDPILNFSLTRGLGQLNTASYEYLGLAYYFARGWTDDLFPAPDQPSG